MNKIICPECGEEILFTLTDLTRIALNAPSGDFSLDKRCKYCKKIVFLPMKRVN